MLYWLFLLITLPAVAGCGYLLILQYEQRELALRELDSDGSSRSERRRKLRPTDFYIKISLKDPLAVARRESMLGRFGSKLAPLLITKEVYKQLEQAIVEQLEERRIEADFSLHITRSPKPHSSNRSARPASAKPAPARPAPAKVAAPRPLASRESTASIRIEEESLLLLDGPTVRQYSSKNAKRNFNPFQSLRKAKIFGGKRSKTDVENIDSTEGVEGRHGYTDRENFDR